MTPHAVSLDRKRLIRHPWVYAQGGHGLLIEWGLTLDFMGRQVVSTTAYPGARRHLGPYMGGPFFGETSWICGLDGLVPNPRPPASGVVRLSDYNELLCEQTKDYVDRLPPRGIDASFQQRDFIDALFLFTRVTAHGMSAEGRLDRPPEEHKFDCIASSVRFLGGRLVKSRIKFNYIATT